MLRYGAKCLPDGAALIRPTGSCRPGKRSATGQGLTHHRLRLHKRPNPPLAWITGAGGDDPRAQNYSRLALFSPYAASSEPGSMREVMPRRFQALIATMAKFSSEISTSEKCSATLR